MAELKQGIFGIDLGTTYSVVSYIDAAGRPVVVRNIYGRDTTPSVVYFENETNVVVGSVAKESAIIDPDNVVALVKRKMGNREYTPTFYGKEYNAPTISALILSALARDAETETGRKVEKAVITVPAYFGMLEKEATRQAGEIAGLDVVGIVPEPVAAALAYGVAGDGEDKTVLVYDLGGGTFDVTVIRMVGDGVEVVVVDGDHDLGGADWDAVIFQHIMDKAVAALGDDSLADDSQFVQDVWSLAEKTKMELTPTESRTVIVRAGGGSFKLVVSRAEFEEMTAHLVAKTIDITSRALETAEAQNPGVRSEITEVLLVGGSSWMPMISAAVRRAFGWSGKLADPDLAIAKGAALYAAGETVKEIVRKTTEESRAADPESSGRNADDGTTTEGFLPSPEEMQAGLEAAAEVIPMDVEKLADFASMSVSNALPKAVGIKLVDDTVRDFESMEPTPFYIEHLVPAQTPLPYEATDPFPGYTMAAGQDRIQIEIWEQAGGLAGRGTHENRLLKTGMIKDLGAYNLPAHSPVHIFFNVDNEGIVRVTATEPTSGHGVSVEAKIALLDAAEVTKSKQTFDGLTSGT